MIPIAKQELLALDGTTSVAPAPILTYSDIQTFLRLDGSADQSLVEGLISAATKRLEEYTNRKFITQVWSIFFDCFPQAEKPDSWWEGTKDGAVSELFAPVNEIDLPFGPLQSMDFIRTYDGTDGTSTFDSSNYSLDTMGPFGRVALRSGSTWPTTVLRKLNGIQMRGVFGFGGTASIPLDIKEAVKITVADLYENRGDADQSGTIPKTAQLLLEPYRIWKLGR